MKVNHVILQAVTKLVVFMILTFAFFLFLIGGDQPGGGFVGGLVLSAAFVLLLLAFDIETIEKGMPLDFKQVAALGAFLVVGTGLSSVFVQKNFLEMSILNIHLPVVGLIEFHTVMIFEAGVALTVLGVVLTIILSISKGVTQWKR